MGLKSLASTLGGNKTITAWKKVDAKSVADNSLPKDSKVFSNTIKYVFYEFVWQYMVLTLSNSLMLDIYIETTAYKKFVSNILPSPAIIIGTDY